MHARKAVTAIAVALLLVCGIVFAGPTKEAPAAAAGKAGGAGAGKYSWPQNWYDAPIATMTRFKEAPVLAEAVKAGKLPPVEQRLPKEPLLVAPYEKVGVYGGTLRVARMGPADWGDMHRGKLSALFRADPSTSKIVPFLAKGYQVSADSKEVTVFLREGAKWSDGKPFTADDIIWFYQNITANPDVPHGSKGWWTFDGKLAVFQKVNDYAFKIVFPKPVSPITIALNLNWNRTQQGYMFTAAHHAKQFHKAFNPDADKLAKDNGYENWPAHLIARTTMDPRQPFNQPEMNIWIQESRDAQGARFVRNPYFWAVDPEGNQLPYIDKLDAVFFSDRQVAILNMMQGKIDIGGRLLNAEEFPLYKENAAKGSYRVLTWQETKMTASGYKFNLTHKEPVKRKVFQDERFRQAMSHAINRDEINQFVFLGLGTSQAFTIDSAASFYDSSWGQYAAQYDVAKAKSLLQQVGLKDVDNDGVYEGPDGKPFVIDMLVSTESVVGSIGMKVSELVADYWRKAGVKVNLKQISQELYESRGDANELDVATFPSEADLETRVNMNFDYDQSGAAFGYAPEWQSWLVHQRWEAGGKKGAEPAKGEEPPADEKKFIELYVSYVNAVDPAQYAKLAKEFWAMATRRLELIGTVGKVARPIIINNRVQNMPERLPFAFETMLWVPPTPMQWYIKE